MATRKMATRKKALGKGLGALIGEAGVTKEGVAGHGNRFTTCTIENIRPNSEQPRKRFVSARLSELADSIKENGIIEPLIVRRNGPSMELIAGERRLRAAAMAGLTEVPVVIMDVTDHESLELALVENIQREDLNAMEEAEAYNGLLGFGMTQAEIAKKVGKERATVANHIRLLKLPVEVKDALRERAITMGHARALLALEGFSAQRALLKRILSQGLSVRETERLGSSGIKEGKKRIATAKTTLHIKPLEAELRRVFGTKVSVVERKGGRGSIVIEYYSDEERERVLDMLRQGP